jgi:long-subunit acyl-CoA synthetase (AMP-forming)
MSDQRKQFSAKKKKLGWDRYQEMGLADGKNCACETQLFQTTVGRIYPHMRAKVVDLVTREVVERGERGELLLSGYSLQKGYWGDPLETAKAMISDREGRVWMQSGDIACIDNEGPSIPHFTILTRRPSSTT